MLTAPTPSQSDIQNQSADSFEPSFERQQESSGKSCRREGYGEASDWYKDRLIEQAYGNRR